MVYVLLVIVDKDALLSFLFGFFSVSSPMSSLALSMVVPMMPTSMRHIVVTIPLTSSEAFVIHA